MDVQWYPGHMAKARRMLIESLKLIDVVVEVVDARAPAATRNPDFDNLFSQKKRVILLNKSDLANSDITKAWIEYYQNQHIPAASIIATRTSSRRAVIALIEEAAAPQVVRMKAKGVLKTVRAMIVGIPNVGKSALINCCVGGSRAKVGDKPGVTKGKQWVKITPYLELMDTPGMLWPKLEDQSSALRLAYLGSINDNIMDVEHLAGSLLKELFTICPENVTDRYGAFDADFWEPQQLLETACRNRGFLLAGAVPDLERGARVILDEFRGGKIAKISLEKVPEGSSIP